MKITGPIIVYLPDTRGVEISRFGKGNLKIGPNVFTYSQLPGVDCPGRSEWCKKYCYAQRVQDPIRPIWKQNSDAGLPPTALPPECRLLRLHVGGDFNSVEYVWAWSKLLQARPDVQAWAATKAWRVSALRSSLEGLRGLPNIQLLASVDESMEEDPPKFWRKAWVEGDSRACGLTCPEETGEKRDCEECRYCFKPGGDVIWRKH
jgi:hypothetical protein